MEQENEKLGVFPYVVAALSFIPYLGLIFGPVAIVWGIQTKKAGGKNLTKIGAIGMLSCVILPTLWFYWFIVTHPDIYHRLR